MGRSQGLPDDLEQLEGRNPVWECMRRQRRSIHGIWMDRGAKPDRRIRRILDGAKEAKIPVYPVRRTELDVMSKGRLHNGVIAKVDPLSIWSMSALLRKLNGQEGDPFLLLADTIAYEQNLGAILRTGLGFGLDGLVIPTRRGAPVSSVAQRVAMGGAEEVHIVKEGLLSAMKQISREGIPIIGADGRGEPVTEVDLTGPLALVVGSEGSGMSSKVRERCDRLVAIPTMGDLESFNVSVATAIVMYERMRQYGEKG